MGIHTVITVVIFSFSGAFMSITTLTIRITREEKERAQVIARKAGITLTALIKQLLLDSNAVKRTVETESVKRAVKQSITDYQYELDLFIQKTSEQFKRAPVLVRENLISKAISRYKQDNPPPESEIEDITSE